MVVVPAVIPVTNPVLSTVATAALEEVHGVVVDGAADPVNCVVEFTHTVGVPVIVGRALTVTTSVIKHPLVLV
jgi:predicted AlkP superfamily pyrophosphatase or phosphodiesterase